MALADIPGLGAYYQRRQQNEQRPLQELQQAGGVMGLLANLQKQQKAQADAAREKQYRSELVALGPDASPEQQIKVASKYAGAEKLMSLRQSELDRKAQRQIMIQTANDKRDQAEDVINLRYDTLAQTAANEEQKRGLEKRRIDELERNNRRHDDTLRVLGQLKAETTREANETRRTIAANKPEKPLTEFQGRNVLFGTRAAQSDKILVDLEEKVSLPGMAAAEMVPGGNYLMTSEQRRVRQAQRDFVNAVLRQESGAVISDAEFANATKQYFPAAGDDKATIAQKRANRKLAIKGFARLAGPGGPDVQTIIDEPLLPTDTDGGTAPPPPPGFKIDK